MVFCFCFHCQEIFNFYVNFYGFWLWCQVKKEAFQSIILGSVFSYIFSFFHLLTCFINWNLIYEMDFSLSWLAGCPKLLSEQFLPLWFEMAHLFSKFSWYLSISGIFDSAPWQSVCLSCASIMHIVLVVVLTIIAGYNRDEYIFFIFLFGFLLLVAIVNVAIFSLVMVDMWKEQLHFCIFILKLAILLILLTVLKVLQFVFLEFTSRKLY